MQRGLPINILQALRAILNSRPLKTAAIGHDHIGENRRLPTERYSGLQEVRVYALERFALLLGCIMVVTAEGGAAQ